MLKTSLALDALRDVESMQGGANGPTIRIRAVLTELDELAQRCQPNGLMFDALGDPRTRYVRVTLNRSHCVMHPSEGDCYVQDARDAGDPDWERYIVRDVWLSEREFEDLPEHDGF